MPMERYRKHWLRGQDQDILCAVARLQLGESSAKRQEQEQADLDGFVTEPQAMLQYAAEPLQPDQAEMLTPQGVLFPKHGRTQRSRWSLV